MTFIGQGEFEAMKTPNGRRASRCDKDQFCAKTTVSTSIVCEISLLTIAGRNKKKERKNKKNGTFATAHFCV